MRLVLLVPPLLDASVTVSILFSHPTGINEPARSLQRFDTAHVFARF